MKDLFYFSNEKMLCWVAGYTGDDNTDNLSAKIMYLTNNGHRFANIANIAFENVNTYYITKSSRYKNMRVFYARVEPENVPEQAFVSTWKMFDWLHD